MSKKLALATGFISYNYLDLDLLPTHIDPEAAEQIQHYLSTAHNSLINARLLASQVGLDFEQHAIDQINHYVLQGKG